MKIPLFIPALFISCICSPVMTATPAFPGAEGAGSMASGGRGGQVYIVTNTNRDGPGSLADAVSRPDRFVVFATSGIIDLSETRDGVARGSKLVISQPNITIAGQTAPGEGICIKGGALNVAASNIVIRHVRVRRGYISEGDSGDAIELNFKDPGYVKPKFEGTGRDKVQELVAAGGKFEPVTDILFDHLSTSWATDENFTMSGHIDRVHAQHCFIAEALDYSNPKQTPLNHAFGSLFGGAGTDSRVGIHHSIFANHRRRTPQCSTGDGSGDPPVVIDFRNNIVYNSIEAFSHTGGNPVRMNFVGNYYKMGPDSEAKLTGKWFTMRKGNDTSKLHAKGNYIHGSPDTTADNWKGVLFDNGIVFDPEMVVMKEYDVPAVTTHVAETAYSSNLQNAGATLPARDQVDTRVATQIRDGTGRVIGKETDLPESDRWPDYRSLPPAPDGDRDGLPDFWEKQFGLDPGNAKDAMRLGAGGFANIEHYVNSTDPRGGSGNVVYVSAHVSRAGKSRPAELRVWRTGSMAGALTVPLSISGDAQAGIDYAEMPDSVTIPANEEFVSVSVIPLPSAREDRKVIISPAGGLVGCPDRALAVIRM